LPLIVVPLARDESHLLTLGEWDLLLSCQRVLFEQTDHPLVTRLQQAGVESALLDTLPTATEGGLGLVVDPRSERVVELARSGARVTSGVASAPDALSAAHASGVARRASAALGGLAVVMARLRSEDGCPWDREQSHRSLLTHLVEEAYEVVDTIESDGPDSDLVEELGDLLLQVAFHSRVAEQTGRFDVADVATGIVRKLIRRHPHVFGDVRVTGAGEVLRNWEAIKASEKGRSDPFEGIPRSAPALVVAAKSQKRAAGMGFDPSETDAVAAAQEAVGSRSVGEALFWVVALARARGLDPEGALREAIRSFRARWSGEGL
jgi:XTP/dITP diphosphohydrolase